MTDQGVAKEQYITVGSLKEIADPVKKFLRKGNRKGRNQKELKFRAKVVNQQLADETGSINFTTEGVAVNNNQTYEFTGSLKVVDYKLNLAVTSATPAKDQIANLGSEQLSKADIDQHSGKHIVLIKDLINLRIGQSFFARPKDIVHNNEQRRMTATLADNTAAIQAEISVNKKSITQEVLESLNSDKVYLFSDVVLNFNESNKLVARFNYRSNIVEANDRQIQQLSNNNLSAKEYSDETEKKALTDVLQIHEKKERVHKQQNKNKNPRNAHKNHNRQRPNLQETEPVKISGLQQWNNNQTVIGKIVSLRTEDKSLPAKQDGTSTTMVYLKGTIGDETGVIDFDMAEKRDCPRFKENDVVKFTSVMNKGRQSAEGKVGGHYIEVKKFGQYIILSDHNINNVNLNNNLSNLELTARPKNPNPRFIKGEFVGVKEEEKDGNIQYTYTVRSKEGEEQSITIRNKITTLKVGEIHKIDRERKRSSSRPNHQGGQRGNRSHSQNNRNQRNRDKHHNSQNNQPNKYKNTSVQNNNNNKNQQRSQSQNQRPPRNYDNRQGGENRNNRQRNENNRNNFNGNGHRVNNQNNQRNRNSSYPRNNNYDHHHNQQTDISGLEPGKRGQNVTGQVIEVSEFSKQINDKTLHFVKGRIADENANIRFDIKKPQNLEIKVGEVYNFKDVNNKVDDNGYHYIDLNRFGRVFPSHKKFQSINDKRNCDADRSSIEYVKKTVPN
uniref:G-quartet DNA-binding protein TGP1 n=1 Tax=Tetrahymena thermophila TaxID=5911 RepID=TGP1_TETTH|nr:RecName: Full=G-quartet DNA-binding protein TGP1 [Tetrahymena thermophila]AAC48333.1 G-quartet DNA binding protein TGP1 [Tetrahymena thermophila]